MKKKTLSFLNVCTCDGNFKTKFVVILRSLASPVVVVRINIDIGLGNISLERSEVGGRVKKKTASVFLTETYNPIRPWFYFATYNANNRFRLFDSRRN